MIAVDTSALMAVVLGEQQADACVRILEAETETLLSAGTLAEALIVAARRNVGDEMARLIEGLGFEIVTCHAGISAGYCAGLRALGQRAKSGRPQLRRLLCL